MKKYFAKYLPVEGEIKEGNMWVYKGYIMSAVKYNYDPYPQDTGEKIKQKVKLFLCSRDIQVGDTVYSDYTTDLPWIACTKEPNKNIQWGFLKNVKPTDFKKIGEISPEATWVKEGMEFDEDEIKLIMSSSYIFHKTGQCMGGEVEGWTERLPQTIKHIEIKGPCGHFH